LSISACTISAYWNIGEVQLIEKMGTADLRTGPPAMSEPRDARHIKLDLAHVDTLQSPEFVRDLIEMSALKLNGLVLTPLLAIAISSIPNPSTDLGYDKPPGPDELNHSALKFTTVLYGHGYGNWSVSVRLAMAVIVTYCVITIVYTTYILITGSTSTAWNSAIELVTLALQSNKPNHLGNSGVGVDSLRTFQEGVEIRVNQNHELELVFAHDRDINKRELKNIEQNREY
jgi:hypothetical protein